MAMLKENVICLENVTKRYKILNHREGFVNSFKDLFSQDYKIINAVENISLNIAQGEIVGFIGPNGAGKSTTIKMMTGVLEPTSGSITVNGQIPYKNRKKNAKSIGVVFGQRSQLWWDLPVIESYKILKEIYQVSDTDFKKNLNSFNSVVDISNLYAQPARMLSLGQRMVCDIFAAFIHNPKIVFLDEPTIGLDVSVKASVREIIQSLNQEKGTTIVLTSHDLSDIETLSRRLVIIDKGQIIYDGSIKDISNRFSGYRTLRLDIAEKKNDFITDIREHFGFDSEINSEGWIEIKISPNTIDLVQLINYVSLKWAIRDLHVEDLKTEEIVRKIYEGAII